MARNIEEYDYDDDDIVVIIRNLTEAGTFQLLHVEPRPGVLIEDMFAFMSNHFLNFASILADMEDAHNYKLDARMEVSFVKRDENGDVINRVQTWLLTHPRDPNGDYDSLFGVFASELGLAHEKFKTESSGWVFEKVHQFDVNRARYQIAPRIGRDNDAPELPPGVTGWSVVRLVRTSRLKGNIGKNCFVDSVTIGCFLADGGTSPEKRWMPCSWRKKFSLDENYTAPTFPASLQDSAGVDVNDSYLFENENPVYLLTVLAINGTGGFYAMRKFRYERFRQIVDAGKVPRVVYLLYHQEHYFCVSNLGALLKQSSTNTRYYCSFCLQSFYRAESRNVHMKDCDTTFVREIAMPEKGSVVNFDRHALAVQRQPFAIYADSECYHERNDTSDQPPAKKTKTATSIIDRHVPFMLGYYLAISSDFEPVLRSMSGIAQLLPEYPNHLYKEFSGEDCVANFVDSLLDLADRMQRLTRFHIMPLTGVEWCKVSGDTLAPVY